MRKRNKVLGLVFALAAVAGGAFWHTEHPSAPVPAAAPPEPITVETVDVATGSIEDTFIAYGSLEAVAKVTIAAQAAGYLSRVMFTDGATIKKGTPLAQLDEKMDRAQVEAARTQARVDEENLTRIRELVRRGAQSTAQLDQATATAAASRATVEVRETELSLLTLVAPIDGTLSTRLRNLGDYVNPGDAIVRLEDRSVLLVQLQVPERLLPSLRQNQSFSAFVGGETGPSITGMIDYVSPAVDQDTRTVAVRGRFDNREGKLVPGQFLEVHLVLGEHEDIVLVPEDCILGQIAGDYVFRVKNGTAEMVRVELGIRANGGAEVRNGLAVGDKVVIRGQFKLEDGTPVRLAGAEGVV